MNTYATEHHIKTPGFSRLCSDRRQLHDVEIIPIATGNDGKDTLERAFNKLAWGNHYGTEGVQYYNDGTVARWG
jgi:hypothetical protein